MDTEMNRRGSSLFSYPTPSMSNTNADHFESYDNDNNNTTGNDLLVDFPQHIQNNNNSNNNTDEQMMEYDDYGVEMEYNRNESMNMNYDRQESLAYSVDTNRNVSMVSSATYQRQDSGILHGMQVMEEDTTNNDYKNDHSYNPYYNASHQPQQQQQQQSYNYNTSRNSGNSIQSSGETSSSTGNEQSSSNTNTKESTTTSQIPLNDGPKRLGEAARMEQLANMQSSSGSKDHRPLVGGFAAAAYEAMREHHFSNEEK